MVPWGWQASTPRAGGKPMGIRDVLAMLQHWEASATGSGAAELGGKRDGQRRGGVGTQAGRVRGPHSGLGFAEVPPAPVDPSRLNRHPAFGRGGVLR